MNASRFHVDLGGLIDLLSQHLYSGTQVFLRELLQNAVDAITARRGIDPAAEAAIRIWLEHDANTPCLAVRDTGIGLTAAQATELLATIGASSKRDDPTSRADYIGQFGVGMLAAFLVSNQIEVTSRSALEGSTPIRWVGYANGEFELHEIAEDVPVGTTVRLRASADSHHWYDEDTVVALARDYGEMLPVDISVEINVPGVGPMWRRITGPAPWQQEYRTLSERSEALAQYCEKTFGFTPLTAIDLSVPLVGLSGVAFVLPQAVAPSAGQHRVYVKGMLVGARVDHILPEWAFFVRAVVSADSLTPSASREQLRHDDILVATQEALGEQLKQWVSSTLRERTRLADSFIEIHHLALRSLALNDDSMLDLVAEVLPYETTAGLRTLREIRDTSEVVYAPTVEAYRRVSTVARAQGLTVVNAGYVYDADIVERLGRKRGWPVRALSSTDLTHVLQLVSPQRETQVANAIARARVTLEHVDCDVLVRTYEPATVPALLLRDPDGEHRRESERERQAAPDRWAGLLDALAPATAQRSRTLVLNDASDNVQRLLSASNGQVFDAALSSLYVSAVMLAGEGLDSAEIGMLNASLGTLLETALADHDTPQED